MESSVPETKNKYLSLFSTEIHKSFTFISKSLPVNESEILICDNQLENQPKLKVLNT